MADRLVFPYIVNSHFATDNVARPFLPIALRYQQNDLHPLALLDSGADVNVLPFHVGAELGVNWEEQQRILGLAGFTEKVEARGIVLDLQIGPWPSIRMAFAWAQLEDAPIILGQVNFFQQIDVCFSRSRTQFELELNSVGDLQ